MAKRQARARSGNNPASLWGGRVLRTLSKLVVIGIVGWAGYTLYRPSTFPVRHVQLMGELGRGDNSRVKAVILPYVTRGFLRVDVNGIRTALEALPWVHQATVRRVWPDVVEVEIQRKRPLARWGDASLVSEEGTIFAPPKAEWPEGLPLLDGPAETARAMVAHYRELREILAPVGLKISSLTMNERRAMTIELDNGVRMLLGRSDQQSRLERFVRAYPIVMEGRVASVGQVDLRYTNGFSVVWKTQGPQV